MLLPIMSISLPMLNMHTFIKLANSDFSVEIGKAEGQATTDFSNYTGTVTSNDIASRLQFAGQERVSWGALTGDTLWLGKVTLREEVTPPVSTENMTTGTMQISVYPNPVTNGTFNLELPGLKGNCQVSIFTTSGKMVYSTITGQHTLTVFASGYKAGVYIIKVSNNNAVLFRKILVE